MRPVDKGKVPDIVFMKYQEAEPYLEKQIGAFCSFCEFPIRHVPEVEHREAKSQGGDTLSWDNMLLSCKYCNTRKGTKVKGGDKEKYLWPDKDDTFKAYSYEKCIPQLNEDYLKSQGEVYYQKAQNLFQLVKLDNKPKLGEKDRRFFARNEARRCAENAKGPWERIKKSSEKSTYLGLICELAVSTGFFQPGWRSLKKMTRSDTLLLTGLPGQGNHVLKKCK